MNYALAREIYGHTPLMVDQATFSTLFNLVNDLRNGVKLEEKAEKLNSISLFEISADAQIVESTYDLKKQEPDAELVYVINLNGPITKNGGMSSYGMKDLAQTMKSFDADKRIKGGVIITDSGGGSASGMELMVHAMSLLTKPLVALVERAGCACSAAYGIIAASDYIISESAESEVGSIGTMISFAGYPNKATGISGEKHVTIYATASTKKNLWFEEALNNDNYELALSDVLDPFNERFMAHIRSSRTGIKDTQLDGSVYNAGDVLGSMVDEIGDLQAAVNKVLELSNAKKLTINHNNTVKAMTAQELLAQHPTVHAEIFGAGVAAERDRTGVWMAHLETDPEAVKTGIKGGNKITDTERENFFVKAQSKKTLTAIKKDSAGNVVTEESPTELEAEKTADQLEFEKIYGKHKVKMN